MTKNRIKKAFADPGAFIAFITAGDPSLEKTEEFIHTLAASGADLIELGIPFSDPVAEGPVIQAANLRALGAGATVDKIFELVARVRQTEELPLVFLTYFNPIFYYGPVAFLKRCQESGVDGLIIPDLPYGENGELQRLARDYGVEIIPLVAPTSANRIAEIARHAGEGFVYTVSSLGVTGVRQNITADVETMVAIVKENTRTPVAVGFGVSTPQQARAISRYADGVIVGSAIVEIIAEHGPDAAAYLGPYVQAMKGACRA